MKKITTAWRSCQRGASIILQAGRAPGQAGPRRRRGGRPDPGRCRRDQRHRPAPRSGGRRSARYGIRAVGCSAKAAVSPEQDGAGYDDRAG